MSCLNEIRKKRATNFSSEDKERLLNIIYNYKEVVENKKTDAVNNDEKAKAWAQIALEFNACGGVRRETEQLKKLYNNSKKNLRKNAAEERKEILLTGGGTSQKRTHEDALLRSIVNEKTIDGMLNEFDGDQDFELENVEKNNEAEVPEPLFKFSRMIENENEHMQQGTSQSWNRYTSSQLQTPVNNALKSSRRRPTPVVKALTSSDVAEKYNKLLDKRLSIAELTESQLKRNIEFEEKKKEMELKILEVEYEIKLETLKKLQGSI